MEHKHYPAAENAAKVIRRRLDFGAEVRIFCAQYGMRIKEVAANSGVSRFSLRDTMQGKIAGHEVIPKVRRYITSVEELSNEHSAT